MLCGMTALTAQAQKVSEEQALQRAQAFLDKTISGKADGKRHTPRKLRQVQIYSALTSDSSTDATLGSVAHYGQPTDATLGSEAYYVFNAEDNGGFVIVSADERLGQILGYSTEGCFDPEKVPANMLAWLKGYEGVISDRGEMMGYRAAVLNEPAVAPLIKTKWHQEWPYNLMTPEQDGQHCVTAALPMCLPSGPTPPMPTT